MKSPFTGGETILVAESRKATFRKEEYEYTHLAYRCLDTGEQFTTTELDEFNVGQIYGRYRAKYGIPYPDEIREVRKRYGLSALKMSQILGFGDNQYRLYENEDIPNVANGRVLKAIQNPRIFETFVDEARYVLTDDEYVRIKRRIAESDGRFVTDGVIERLVYGDNGRDRYNGFAMRSVAKLKNVILFYIGKFNGVFVTQMNKLLFYTDFASFRDCGRAMTGLSFRAIQYGPVPDRWDRVYGLIDGVFQIEAEGRNGNRLVSDQPCDMSGFTDEETAVLERVYDTFKNDSAASISRKSHEERAWKDNQETHSFIDFAYAFSLKAI